MKSYSLNIDKHSFWNASTEYRTSNEDAEQLEYDEHDINLIADRGKRLSVTVNE